MRSINCSLFREYDSVCVRGFAFFCKEDGREEGLTKDIHVYIKQWHGTSSKKCETYYSWIILWSPFLKAKCVCFYANEVTVGLTLQTVCLKVFCLLPTFTVRWVTNRVTVGCSGLCQICGDMQKSLNWILQVGSAAMAGIIWAIPYRGFYAARPGMEMRRSQKAQPAGSCCWYPFHSWSLTNSQKPQVMCIPLSSFSVIVTTQHWTFSYERHNYLHLLLLLQMSREEKLINQLSEFWREPEQW